VYFGGIARRVQRADVGMHPPGIAKHISESSDASAWHRTSPHVAWHGISRIHASFRHARFQVQFTRAHAPAARTAARRCRWMAATLRRSSRRRLPSAWCS